MFVWALRNTALQKKNVIFLIAVSNEALTLCRNAEKILGYLNSNVLSHDLIPPHVNFSHLTTSDYAEMYGVIKTVKEGAFAQLELDPCLLEDELNKVSVWTWTGTGYIRV